jgi:hypothetical protein
MKNGLQPTQPTLKERTMRETTVTIKDNTIEIPDGLIQPFKALASILEGLEFEHPIELLQSAMAAELISKCEIYVVAAIGKAFAHTLEISEVTRDWLAMTDYERLIEVLSAAAKAEPLGWSGTIKSSRAA